MLTPTAATDLEAFDRLKGVVMSLGADVLVLSAADHDRLVAVVSHVPHLVAATLMNAASAGAEQDGALLRLAAGGFRDMTRVAAGHPGHLARHLRRERRGHRRRARRAGRRPRPPCATGWPRRDRDGAARARSRRPARPGATCPARVVRPDHLAELRIPVPDRAGVLAEITSLAADAGIGIYDIEIAHSAEGPAGVLILVVDGADAETLAAAVEAHGLPRAGPSSCRDGAPHPRRRRRRRRAAAPCARRARSRSRTAPCSSARWPRGRRSSTGSPTAPTWPPRWPRSRRWAPASSATTTGRSSSTAGGRACTDPPAPLDCGNSGTSMRLLAGLVAGFDWETELVGDESLSARPMDRVAEPLGLMGAHGARAAASACLPPLRVRGGALHGHRLDVQGGQRPGEVGHPPGRPVGRRHDRRARGGDDPHPHRGDAGRGGGRHHGRAVGRGARRRASGPRRCEPVDRTVPGDPSAVGLLRRGGVRRAGQRRRGGRRLRRAGPARLRVGAPADGGRRDRSSPASPARRPSAPSPGPLRATEVPASEIPSLDEIPVLAVAAAVAEGTTVFSDVGELRVKEVDRLAAVADMVEAFGARAAIEGDTLAVTGAGGPLRGARFDSRGDHRMAMAAAVAALAARAGRAQPHHRASARSRPATRRSPRTCERLAGGRRAPRPLLVAIDGPAGAGKSTVSTRGGRAARASTGSTPAPCTGPWPRSPWSVGIAARRQRRRWRALAAGVDHRGGGAGRPSTGGT